jgi:hypothetical protein
MARSIWENQLTLDEFLLAKNRIGEEQLAGIRRVHASEGGGWASHLVDAGAITENELLQLLLAETGLPYLPLLQMTIADDLLREFTTDFLQTFECVPLDRVGPVLTMVTPNPFQPELFRSRGTRQTTIHLYLCRVSEWRECLRRLQEHNQTERRAS